MGSWRRGVLNEYTQGERPAGRDGEREKIKKGERFRGEFVMKEVQRREVRGPFGDSFHRLCMSSRLYTIKGK